MPSGKEGIDKKNLAIDFDVGQKAAQSTSQSPARCAADHFCN